MSEKVIDGMLYELVASAEKNKLNLYGDAVREHYLQLQHDFISARHGWDSIKKRLAIARFSHEHYGRIRACEEYEMVLKTILFYENRNYPRYKDLAIECAMFVANKYLETDCIVNDAIINDTKAFYRNKKLF